MLSLSLIPLILLLATSNPRDPGIDVITSRCITCHDAMKRAGGLDLSMRDSAIKAIAPGNPSSSKLIRMVDSGKMQPTGKLADSEIEAIKRWIRAGARYPNEPLKAISPAM